MTSPHGTPADAAPVPGADEKGGDVSEGREKLYYSISEVSDAADVKPHVLRYWETQFKMLRPRKNRAGNRMYRPRDLNLVLTIKALLYDAGYTIAGARRRLLDARRQGALVDGQLIDGEARVVRESPVAAMSTSAPDVDDVDDPDATTPENDDQLTLADAERVSAVRAVRRDLEAVLRLLDRPQNGPDPA